MKVGVSAVVNAGLKIGVNSVSIDYERSFECCSDCKCG